jgi:hypothetical protein
MKKIIHQIKLWLATKRVYRKALEDIRSELGVPSVRYPANVANAWEIANSILGEE